MCQNSVPEAELARMTTAGETWRLSSDWITWDGHFRGFALYSRANETTLKVTSKRVTGIKLMLELTVLNKSLGISILKFPQCPMKKLLFLLPLSQQGNRGSEKLGN